MAAHLIAVVQAYKVDIPEELRDDPRFRNGARLQLVPLPQEISDEERLKAWENFKSLEGILAHSDYDPNAELEKEKQRELAKEAGWPVK